MNGSPELPPGAINTGMVQASKQLHAEIDRLLQTDVGRTNDILHETDRSHILSVLGDAEAEIRALDTHIMRLSKFRIGYIMHTQRLRVAISSQKYLPEEVLAEIFVHAVGRNAMPQCVFNISEYPRRWVFMQVCSRWRQVALAEPRLWTAIFFKGSPSKVPLLHAFFDRCAASPIRLNGVEFLPLHSHRTFIEEVIRPRSHQIVALVLTFTSVDAFRELVRLPAGSFDNLERVSMYCADTLHFELEGVINLPVQAFDRATSLMDFGLRSPERLPHVGFKSEFPLSFNLPWSQLTRIDITPAPVQLFLALRLLNSCPNLVFCRLRLISGLHCLFNFDGDATSESGTASNAPDDSQDIDLDVDGFPIEADSGIDPRCHLPFLRELHLETDFAHSPDLFGDFLLLLSLPSVQDLSFSMIPIKYLILEWSPNELARVVERKLTSPHLRSTLFYRSRFGIEIEQFAPLRFLTSIHADCAFPDVALNEIGRGTFPKLSSLYASVKVDDMDSFFSMLKARWIEAKAQGPENYTGIWSGRIRVLQKDKENNDLLPELSRRLKSLKEELGVEGAQIDLY